MSFVPAGTDLGVKLLTSNDEGYGLKNMGLILSLSKAYTIPLQMQSHGLGMTPVSIKQLRATL
jgi:hypothetical protein